MIFLQNNIQVDLYKVYLSLILKISLPGYLGMETLNEKSRHAQQNCVCMCVCMCLSVCECVRVRGRERERESNSIQRFKIYFNIDLLQGLLTSMRYRSCYVILKTSF